MNNKNRTTLFECLAYGNPLSCCVVLQPAAIHFLLCGFAVWPLQPAAIHFLLYGLYSLRQSTFCCMAFTACGNPLFAVWFCCRKLQNHTAKKSLANHRRW